MKLPPLPEPTIIDGSRTMYTATAMRNYGKRCFEAGYDAGVMLGRNSEDEPMPSDTNRYDDISELFGFFGKMK